MALSGGRLLLSLPVIDSSSNSPRPSFETQIGGPLTADVARTLQINIGLRCNLACKHCHVASSPRRDGNEENMSGETIDRILAWLVKAEQIRTVDITGGSPEMNPHFRRLVRGVRSMGRGVINRCNPTILTFNETTPSDAKLADDDSADDESFSNNYRWVPAFLAEHSVTVFASLPCYLPENVRHQRGVTAYDESIAGLKLLNDVGYGIDSDLPLNLVFNPTGISLPPPVGQLESEYRRYLAETFNLHFTNLVTITNMPIARWKDWLLRRGKHDEYIGLLRRAFNSETVDGLMCRHQIHVDCQGRMSDCDFNYAVGMPANVSGGNSDNGSGVRYLWDAQPTELDRRSIVTAEHCFGCTAGSGSSCAGSLV